MVNADPDRRQPANPKQTFFLLLSARNEPAITKSKTQRHLEREAGGELKLKTE
jgi:hypothetical protein